MAEYFATMRQFLETQERVMDAFLGGAGTVARPSLRLSRSIASALPRVTELPLPAPMASVTVQAPPDAAPRAEPKPVATKAVAPAPTASAAPVPAAAASPGPHTAPAATSVPAPAATAPAAGIGLTRERLLELLLGIVEEKTGYPRDMVGVDQNLEADLGIDSIKRIEVVGELLQQLPAAHRDALTAQRSKLNTQPTLGGMLDLVASVQVGGAVAVPFESAGGTQGSMALPAPSATHPGRS